MVSFVTQISQKINYRNVHVLGTDWQYSRIKISYAVTNATHLVLRHLRKDGQGYCPAGNPFCHWKPSLRKTKMPKRRLEMYGNRIMEATGDILLFQGFRQSLIFIAADCHQMKNRFTVGEIS